MRRYKGRSPLEAVSSQREDLRSPHEHAHTHAHTHTHMPEHKRANTNSCTNRNVMFNVICTVSHIRSLFRKWGGGGGGAHMPPRTDARIANKRMHYRYYFYLFFCCRCCDLMQWEGRWNLNDRVFIFFLKRKSKKKIPEVGNKKIKKAANSGPLPEISL